MMNILHALSFLSASHVNSQIKNITYYIDDEFNLCRDYNRFHLIINDKIEKCLESESSQKFIASIREMKQYKDGDINTKNWDEIVSNLQKAMQECKSDYEKAKDFIKKKLFHVQKKYKIKSNVLSLCYYRLRAEEDKFIELIFKIFFINSEEDLEDLQKNSIDKQNRLINSLLEFENFSIAGFKTNNLLLPFNEISTLLRSKNGISEYNNQNSSCHIEVLGENNGFYQNLNFIENISSLQIDFFIEKLKLFFEDFSKKTAKQGTDCTKMVEDLIKSMNNLFDAEFKIRTERSEGLNVDELADFSVKETVCSNSEIKNILNFDQITEILNSLKDEDREHIYKKEMNNLVDNFRIQVEYAKEYIEKGYKSLIKTIIDDNLSMFIDGSPILLEENKIVLNKFFDEVKYYLYLQKLVFIDECHAFFRKIIIKPIEISFATKKIDLDYKKIMKMDNKMIESLQIHFISFNLLNDQICNFIENISNGTTKSELEENSKLLRRLDYFTGELERYLNEFSFMTMLRYKGDCLPISHNMLDFYKEVINPFIDKITSSIKKWEDQKAKISNQEDESILIEYINVGKSYLNYLKNFDKKQLQDEYLIKLECSKEIINEKIEDSEFLINNPAIETQIKKLKEDISEFKNIYETLKANLISEKERNTEKYREYKNLLEAERFPYLIFLKNKRKEFYLDRKVVIKKSEIKLQETRIDELIKYLIDQKKNLDNEKDENHKRRIEKSIENLEKDIKKSQNKLEIEQDQLNVIGTESYNFVDELREIYKKYSKIKDQREKIGEEIHEILELEDNYIKAKYYIHFLDSLHINIIKENIELQNMLIFNINFFQEIRLLEEEVTSKTVIFNILSQKNNESDPSTQLETLKAYLEAQITYISEKIKILEKEKNELISSNEVRETSLKELDLNIMKLTDHEHQINQKIKDLDNKITQLKTNIIEIYLKAKDSTKGCVKSSKKETKGYNIIFISLFSIFILIGSIMLFRIYQSRKKI